MLVLVAELVYRGLARSLSLHQMPRREEGIADLFVDRVDAYSEIQMSRLHAILMMIGRKVLKTVLLDRFKKYRAMPSDMSSSIV